MFLSLAALQMVSGFRGKALFQVSGAKPCFKFQGFNENDNENENENYSRSERMRDEG